MKFKYFSQNGNIFPTEKANIPLSNIGYAYGFGVYETLRIRNGIIYFHAQHIKRLLKSAGILGIAHQFIQKDIEKYIYELIEREKVNSCNIKILLIGGKTKEESLLSIIPLAPFFPNRKFYIEGVKTITFRYERLFPQAKTLNMLGSYLAYRKAHDQECYDALLTDHNSNILEGTRTNFFAIKNNTIFTQSSEKILAGVTRETVLHIAKKNAYKIEEKEISVNQLAEYDSTFLTSTSSKILPVKQIDDYIFGAIPQALKFLMQKYDEFLKDSNGVFNEKE